MLLTHSAVLGKPPLFYEFHYFHGDGEGIHQGCVSVHGRKLTQQGFIVLA